MHNIRETELPTDLVAGLLMEAGRAPAPVKRRGERPTGRIYAVMAATTAVTFAVLTTGFQLLFIHQAFA